MYFALFDLIMKLDKSNYKLGTELRKIVAFSWDHLSGILDFWQSFKLRNDGNKEEK